ncbi:MAG: hypothetical protein IPK58_22090 [Acidobacteria bacterium]|nr:hypothetical protein [Acidobacteriota bacterium]
MTKITKAEFDALPESLKAQFTADGDGYALNVPDVEGLKQSKEAILREKKELTARLAELERFKSEIDTRKSADEEEKLRAAGEFAKIEERYKAKIAEIETGFAAKESQLMNNFKTERLKNELTARGVLADRAKYALADIADRVELISGETGFQLKVKDGLGDPKELDALINGMKESSPFFFTANGAAGSGASGGGTSNGVTNAKQMPYAQFSSLDVKAQAAFIKDGGNIAPD